jgi:hypothetical protein
VGGALLARIDSHERRLAEQFREGIASSEQRLLAELARHTRAIQESMSTQISVVDEKYDDLPARVRRLEATVFTAPRGVMEKAAECAIAAAIFPERCYAPRMFEHPTDRFETDFCPAGGPTVLLLTRREGLGSETRLYRSDDEGALFAPIAAPDRIHTLAARAGRWLAVAGNALHESRDDGAHWTVTSLGGTATWTAATLIGDEAWVAGGDRVISCAASTTEIKWRLPSAGAEFLCELILVEEGGVLVTSNVGRILRGYEGVVELVDWSQGLPTLHAGAGSATIGRVGDAWLAFFDGLHVRRDCDPAWTLLSPEDKPDGSWRDALCWLLPKESAQWVPLPWQPGAWLGTDGANLFIGGPGRALSSVWRRPNGSTLIKRLDVSEGTVYASLRNATTVTAGLAVRRDGAHVIRLG